MKWHVVGAIDRHTYTYNYIHSCLYTSALYYMACKLVAEIYNYKDVDFSDNNNFNFSPNFDIFAINIIACNK